MKYEEKTNEELSGLVLKAIYGYVVDYWCLSDCETYIYDCGPIGDQFNKIDLIDINNPSDIMSIAFDNDIEVSIGRHGGFKTGKYIARGGWDREGNENYPSVVVFDKNPYRAIAICFLKMKDAEVK